MDFLRRLVFQRSLTKRACAHLAAIAITDPAPPECEPCRETGSKWVHVRMCMTCGATGCCDSSKLQHARRHHEVTGHPLIRSVEGDEAWAWCYEDEAYLAASDYA